MYLFVVLPTFYHNNIYNFLYLYIRDLGRENVALRMWLLGLGLRGKVIIREYFIGITALALIYNQI